MTQLIEQTINSTKIYEGKIINLRLDKVKLPDGKEASREIVENSEATAVIPYQKKEVILIKQYRSAIGKVILEVPAGKTEFNESPIESARRELEEETGYKAGTFKKIGAFYTSPGFTNELLHLYLATDLSQYQQKEDAEEFIEIKKYSIKELKELIAKNQIKDLKTYTLLNKLFNHLD